MFAAASFVIFNILLVNYDSCMDSVWPDACKASCRNKLNFNTGFKFRPKAFHTVLQLSVDWNFVDPRNESFKK